MTEASSHHCSMAQEWRHLPTVSLVLRISRGGVTHLLLVSSTSSVTPVATPLLPSMEAVMCPHVSLSHLPALGEVIDCGHLPGSGRGPTWRLQCVFDVSFVPRMNQQH